MFLPVLHSNQIIMDKKQDIGIGSDTPRQSESPSTDEEVLDLTSDKLISQGNHASAGQEISPEVSGATGATQQHPEHIGSPAYGPHPLPRAPIEAKHGPVATLYLDSECADDLASQSFVELSTAEVLPPGTTSSESLFSKDDSSVNRLNSGSPALPNLNSPPSLSSSTDSLASSETPSSSHTSLFQRIILIKPQFHPVCLQSRILLILLYLGLLNDPPPALLWAVISSSLRPP